MATKTMNAPTDQELAALRTVSAHERRAWAQTRINAFKAEVEASLREIEALNNLIAMTAADPEGGVPIGYYASRAIERRAA